MKPRASSPPVHPAPRPESSDPSGEFISERLQPAGSDFALPAAIGEPALPLRFVWRRKTYEIAAVLRRWKEYDADRTHGSAERYLRRHWFDLRLTDGSRWTIYFLRQPASRRSAKARWWLNEKTT